MRYGDILLFLRKFFYLLRTEVNVIDLLRFDMLNKGVLLLVDNCELATHLINIVNASLR